LTISHLIRFMLRQTVHKQYSESHYENRVEIRKPFLIHNARMRDWPVELFSAHHQAPFHATLLLRHLSSNVLSGIPDVETSSADFIMSLSVAFPIVYNVVCFEYRFSIRSPWLVLEYFFNSNMSYLRHIKETPFER